MDEIKVGSAVKITWPLDSSTPSYFPKYDGKVGVVLEKRGRMRSCQGEDCLWLIDVDGHLIHSVLAESHLSLLRPDLEQYIHSTRYALTASDVVHDHLNRQRY